MFHQPEKVRQIVLFYAPLIEGEDERARLRHQQEIGVLDAFGDALAGDDPADIVLVGERLDLLVGDFCIDGHHGILSWVAARR
jgi:hypothetical protein